MSSDHSTAMPPTDGSLEFWFVSVCPECRQQQGETSTTHTGDCPNRDKMFVPLTFPVVSWGDYLCRTQEIRAFIEEAEPLIDRYYGRINQRIDGSQLRGLMDLVDALAIEQPRQKDSINPSSGGTAP